MYPDGTIGRPTTCLKNRRGLRFSPWSCPAHSRHRSATKPHTDQWEKKSSASGRPHRRSGEHDTPLL